MSKNGLLSILMVAPIIAVVAFVCFVPIPPRTIAGYWLHWTLFLTISAYLAVVAFFFTEPKKQ